MPCDPALRDIVVLIEQLSPAVVADADVGLGGRDDVGEQYRRQHPVGRGLRRITCEECRRLRKQTLCVPVAVEIPLVLDELRGRNVLGEPASQFDRHKRVTPRVQDERRNGDRRQDAPHIDFEVVSHDLRHHLRRARVPLIARDDRHRFGRDVLYDHAEARPCAPQIS
jgi:hypothetical protein